MNSPPTGTYSADLRELLTISHVEKPMQKDEYLYQEGDESDAIHYILSGKVQIGKITPDGRELTFRICGADDLIGEVTPFCEPSKYTVSAKVIEEGKVAKIRKEELEEELLKKPTLAREYLKWMGIHHQRTQSKFRDLILHGKKGALYSTLIRLANSYGVEDGEGILIDLSLTNMELANFCGMAREAVNRMLSELKKEQRISLTEGKIIIHDLQYLKDQIHCENCPVEFCTIY